MTQISPGSAATARDWLRELRVHQWSKNLLLVLPLILAHKVTSLPTVATCLVAMVAFSLFASAVYIVNDLIDLPHDREHPTKSKRPIARGIITIRQAALAAGGLGGDGDAALRPVPAVDVPGDAPRLRRDELGI